MVVRHLGVVHVPLGQGGHLVRDQPAVPGHPGQGLEPAGQGVPRNGRRQVPAVRPRIGRQFMPLVEGLGRVQRRLGGQTTPPVGLFLQVV